MKNLISLLLVLMVIFGSISVPACAEDDPVESILASMTLRDKVTQMMIASFRIWQEVPPEGGE